MITAHRSIDTVLQREMKFASTLGWKIPWCSHCFISEIIVFILIMGLLRHCYIHWNSHEMKASLTHPKRSLNAMWLGTIGSVMPSIFCPSYYCDQAGNQREAPGYRKPFLSVPAGRWWQHVSSCHAQLLASEVIPWVGAGCKWVVAT